MMDAKTLFSRFSTAGLKDKGRLLESVQPSDLVTRDDHKKYIEMLRSFRFELSELDELKGRGYKQLIQSLLSVGEDGVYSNKLRFLYELIQNVDDCDYNDLGNCELEVRFDTNNDLIVLTYNERGFEPQNVFAITGTAERAKNVSADKVEIGEKGIGFKSVFGVAESVLIQSGMFSFELHQGDFTVPIPCYDEKFSEVKGTRLTLRMKKSSVYNIYNTLVKQYSQLNVLLNENPVLFLNKLTHMKFFIDNSWRYMVFDVSRSDSTNVNGMMFEEDVLISVNIADPQKQPMQKEIRCYRYKMPIVYNREACVSRYSEETEFNRKPHFIIAVLPHPEELEILRRNGIRGQLYSFLPTQIKLNMPIMLHVPYKLDSSRGFIDPQGGNLWFNYTNEKLSDFMRDVYIDLAERVKEKIVCYLPRKNECFFNIDNEKVSCLKRDCFHGATLLEEKLFFTSANTFEKSKDVVSFKANAEIDNPVNMHSLLSISKKLFIPPPDVNMSGYDVELIDDVYTMLFVSAVKKPSIIHTAFEIIQKRSDLDYRKAIDSIGRHTLTAKQVEVICMYPHILKAFQENAEEKIKNHTLPVFNVCSQATPLDSSNKKILDELLDDVDLQKGLLQYINSIKRQYAVLPLPKGVFFACTSMLILSEDEPLDAYASFAGRFIGNDRVAPLWIRQASEKLNSAVSDDSMSNSEYLALLSRERKNIKRCYGDKVYNNYIRLINDSGTDEKRFIYELLQNADDCDYEKAKVFGELPFFICELSDLIITTHYNEDGFTKANVRSITAIGESTKKQIQSDHRRAIIGEKGVGFKSVFSVASEVAIHSNGFHFRLTEEMPTIPQRTELIKIPQGTKMIFSLKKTITKELFTRENVLVLCLCLRRLKKIKLGSYVVKIDDSPTRRIVYIDGEKYFFKKYSHYFTVENRQAIEERENHQRVIDPKQEICFYMPDDSNTSDKVKAHHLYSGLPTTIQMNIPLIIDAPFEVTTSREEITQREWNKIVRHEVYNALIAMLHSMKHERKAAIFSYINDNGIFRNAWLNDYPLCDRISNEDLVPLLSGAFATPKKQECWSYPDICLYLFKNNMVHIPSRNIIETPKHSDILKWLGCKRVSTSEVVGVISEAVNCGYIAEETFRKRLYAWLKSSAQTIHSDSGCRAKIVGLNIIPTKPKMGNESLYISCHEKIYTASDNYSTSEYFLLEDKLLSVDDIFEIFKKIVPPMDHSQKQSLYKEKVIEWLNNPSKQQVAEWLLNEYNNNRPMMDSCRYDLIGRIKYNQIPFRCCDGQYYSNSMFVNRGLQKHFGKLANRLTIAPEYNEFAGYLGCASVLNIHYDDIAHDVGELTPEDVEDLLHGGFEHKYEIIRGFYNDGKILDDLIIQYDLEWLDTGDTETYDDEFPKHKVKNLTNLRNEVMSEELNEYEFRLVKERVPFYTFDKRGYVLEEYRSSNIHFCQKCKEPKTKKYIEVNAIEREPKFAWKQMQLCFCLTCSKDFESFHNNTDIRNEFIKALSDADINDDEPICVIIGDINIFFTATHLAYIQEILQRQKVEMEGG
jgi:hypothetical protein